MVSNDTPSIETGSYSEFEGIRQRKNGIGINFVWRFTGQSDTLWPNDFHRSDFFPPHGNGYTLVLDLCRGLVGC